MLQLSGSGAMHPAPGRPIGPRNIQRSASPNPYPVSVSPVAPLNIRKAPRLEVPSAHTPLATSRSTTPTPRHPPKLGLAIPSPAAPAPTKPSLKLSLNGIAPVASKAQAHDTPTEAFAGGYYGGPPLSVPAPANDDLDEVTIRPPLQTTTKPPSMDDVRRTITEIETHSSSAPAPSTLVGEEKHMPYPHTEWSDEVFEEISRLGEGAGGAVHEVKDVRTGIVMARKTITTREAPMKQLLRELGIITSISHVNIIHFYGAYMSPSSSEIKVVMEVCEGKSLEAVGKRIKERGARVGEKVAGRLAEGVLQGLAYLHSKKLIHRDIKPSNILLSREGIVKLCDFGVSGELVESRAGTFTGTSLYMAPERLSGLEYSIRADVWSTGLSLLELIQNRFPFTADLPPIELMIHVTQSEPPQLEDEPGVRWSDEMKDFIKETLRVDPALRPPPKEMLSHPWIVNLMKQEVNMARWIREVWGWPKPPSRKSKDSSSRPSSSRAFDAGSLDASS